MSCKVTRLFPNTLFPIDRQINRVITCRQTQMQADRQNRQDRQQYQQSYHISSTRLSMNTILSSASGHTLRISSPAHSWDIHYTVTPLTNRNRFFSSDSQEFQRKYKVSQNTRILGNPAGVSIYLISAILVNRRRNYFLNMFQNTVCVCF